MKLKGKVAVVPVASRGIGKVIALEFAKQGARVVVAARSEVETKLPGTIYATVDEIKARGGEAIAVKCDISEEEQVAAMVKKTLDTYGVIDILVNNAAVQINGLITEVPVKHWDLGFKVNVKGPFLAMRYVLPHMAARKSGNVVNVTSGAALSTSPRATNYVLTKVALERLNLIVSNQYKPDHIAANCFDPGPVLTEGAKMVMGKSFDLSGHRPPALCGPPVVWLAMQTAETFTGQVVRMNDWLAKGGTGF